MNVTPTSNNPLPGAAVHGEPAVAGAAPAAAFDPLFAPAPAGAQEAAAPFAQWLAQALPELLAEAAPAGAEDDVAVAAADTPSDDGAADNAPASDGGIPAQPMIQDLPPLAAMAAPLMAPMAAPLPAGGRGGAPAPAPTAASSAAAEVQAAGGDVLLAAIALGAAPGPAAGAQPPAAPGRQAREAQDARTAQGLDVDAATPAPAAVVATTGEAPAPAAATAQARPAAPGPAGASNGAPADTATQDRPASVATAVWGAAGAAAAAPAAAAGAAVALEGPPAAWRQTLHNALGERLQMQAGSGMEQAVIRLEPPNLGRIDIAIRHSAGALEVSLSATNTEVVRQLHAVTDNLRSDLASRQYSEVSVTVAQAAPRAQPGASNPFADQQGRGRQPSREQGQAAPGMALAENSIPDTSFSLNGRD
jgi:flagellar hook-length control protein FliK